MPKRKKCSKALMKRHMNLPGLLVINLSSKKDMAVGPQTSYIIAGRSRTYQKSDHGEVTESPHILFSSVAVIAARLTRPSSGLPHS